MYDVVEHLRDVAERNHLYENTSLYLAAAKEIERLRVKTLELEADHETGTGKCEQLLSALKEARAAIVCRTYDEGALSAIDAALALDDRDA
jgi:hypothetical protein